MSARARLIALDRVGSTNDEAKRLLGEGATDGTVVTAREQTEGRGRRGRVWSSPPGNLYLSVALRPDVPAARLPELGLLASVALTDALAPLMNARAFLGHKWPNDVLLSGKKLAGILVETLIEADSVAAVVGMGVNVASHPDGYDRPATSLAAEGMNIAADALIAPVSRSLLGWRDRWLREGFAPVRDAWLARASGLGLPMRLRGADGVRDGLFTGLDEDGALLLGGAGGVSRVAVGEILGAA